MSHAEWDDGTPTEPVDIIVVTFNRLLYLKECIRSIRENTRYPYGKLIVVDNHSEDGTVEWLQEQAAEGNLIPVFLEKNVGRIKGLYAGMELSDCEIVAISDDDAWYNPGWLTVCMRILELWPEVSVTSADHRRTLEYVRTERRKGISIDFRTSLRTFHLVFRRSIVEEAGGMKIARGKLLGSGFPFGKLHEIGGHSAKFTIETLADRGNVNRLIRPYTELGNADAEGVRYVEHMAHPSHPKSHHDYYESTGYKEFARRAKLGGDPEFVPKPVEKGEDNGS